MNRMCVRVKPKPKPKPPWGGRDGSECRSVGSRAWPDASQLGAFQPQNLQRGPRIHAGDRLGRDQGTRLPVRHLEQSARRADQRHLQMQPPLGERPRPTPRETPPA